MKMDHRASGVLLHITSLPSDFGIGDLGPESYRFVDLLAQANQSYWSILPLTATSIEYGNSPYQPASAFAGNTLLISPELLVKEGLLTREYAKKLMIPSERASFIEATTKKNAMLKSAYQTFVQNRKSNSKVDDEFEKFCWENESWLFDYALFKAIGAITDKPWFKWPHPIRHRNPKILAQKKLQLEEQVEQEKFAQFLFTNQWCMLRDYCHKRGVRIIGDLPFYVAYNSADAWVHSELFKLDAKSNPLYVGGVPPDYFSETGQRWGNPVYNWREMKRKKFHWWMQRILRSLKMCDLLRLDHFRGYIAYWQIPANSKTAKDGSWIRAPTKNFFKTLKQGIPTLPLIAEDLGMITDNVKKYVDGLEVYGMRVLLFGFDGATSNPNLPLNMTENSVVYTGTHDTNTVNGWFLDEATQKQKDQVFDCLGKKVPKNQVSQEFIKLAAASKSKLCLIPMQDILGLGSEARMNYPADQRSNWDWRLKKVELTSKNFENLAKITEDCSRKQ